jgi:phthiocerol/phenolphthiocerol synthesis type-I polyketide synthase C
VDGLRPKIALVSYACKFPGGADFVKSLYEGLDFVTDIDTRLWPVDTFHHPNKKQPGTTYAGKSASLGDLTGFDAEFFGISPREAASMDPQQRFLLELAWETFENAGIKPSTVRGSNTGVFIGISSSDYAFRFLDDMPAIDASVATGTTASIAANRLSYFFDLCGPSMAIDTACSSSLVAFHQACNAIVSGESEMALAGGISLHCHPYPFIIFSKASMLSRKGRCHVFDEAGDGYVRSEGAGLFLLKDYARAVADGDPVLAVVAASAVNTDGYKSGLTVPRAGAQATLLRNTYRRAGIDANEIDYIEAHGTGTAVGDPIETQAIGEALGKQRPRGNPLPLGSVKSNLGHMEPASGVAGMVKALACLRHRQIPATIGIQQLNSRIDFDALNLAVVTRNQPLDPHKTLTVGVNSFGFGGANAHVVLQSHPSEASVGQDATPSMPPLVLSARSAQALQTLAGEYAGRLSGLSVPEYYQLAYSACFHRDWLTQRLLVTADSPSALAARLADFGSGRSEAGAGLTSLSVPVSGQGAAFVYSGNGSQWFAMGKALLDAPVFKAAVAEVDAYFQPLAGYSLAAELAGEHGEDRLELTEIAQPALFAMQVGISAMLHERGIRPQAVTGHSVGEVAAAWAAGILSLPDAVQVIYHRSQKQGATRGKGQMTAVALAQADGLALLDELAIGDSLVVAGVNSSTGITLAGDHAALGRVEAVLRERGVRHKRLNLDYAFHSAAMDSIQVEVEQALGGVTHQQANTAFYSTVSGGRLDEPGPPQEYWWHNIRQPVLFDGAIRQMLASGCSLFIEVGPHAILSGYINEMLRESDRDGRVISTITREAFTPEKIDETCAQAILAGATIDWQRYFPRASRYSPLPNYPWQRESHWIQDSHEGLGGLTRFGVHPLLGYPLTQMALYWENRLDTLAFPSLGDHVVGDSAVFPGTGYAELGLAAAIAWRTDAQMVEIEELEILAPLLLNDQHAKATRLQIDADDGHFALKSREYNSSEAWTLNARGRILPSPQKLQLASMSPLVLPERPADFSGETHVALLKEAGLGYGPAYQCVEQGWVDAAKVVAQLQVPACIAQEVDRMHLHPALLDCTFQLIIHFLQENRALYQGMVFVPAKIGRLSFRVGAGHPRSVQARLLHRSPHSLTAEFSLFDAEGQGVARIGMARFKGVRLETDHKNRLDLLDYHGIPMPHPQSATVTGPLHLEDVQAGIEEMLKNRLLQGIDHHYAEEVEPLLDSLGTQLTLEALQQLVDGDDGLIGLQLVQQYRDQSADTALYLDYLLDSMVKDDMLQAVDDGWQLPGLSQNDASAREIWNILLADYPDYFPLIHSIGRVGLNLQHILAGQTRLAEMVTANGNVAIPISHTLGPQRRQEVGEVIRHLVNRGRTQLAAGQRFALLEVGHQRPMFAMDICLSMDFSCCDYLYASAAVEAYEEALRFQDDFPEMDCLHLEGDAEETEVMASTDFYQLVILTLDFETLQQAQQSLQFARSRLAPGGTLLLLGQHPARWIDFALGATPGWFQRVDGKRLSSQKPLTYWRQQLQQMGLTAVTAFDLSPDCLSDVYFVVAHREEADNPLPLRPAETHGHWVFVADRDSPGQELVQQLDAQLHLKGYRSSLLFSEDIAGCDELLQEISGGVEPIRGIVDICGLQTRSGDAQGMLNACVHRCGIVAQLVQSLERSKLPTCLWVLTHAAAWDLLPYHAGTQVSADAAVRGFARTLVNESSTFSVRLIDMEIPAVSAAMLSGLMRELEQPDDEQEVVLGGNGSRYVPRLRLSPEVSAEIGDPTREQSATLQFDFPGQLRNLHWKLTDRRKAIDDDVEVAVHATGLNFRDLMYALGLLSDEAVENGFAGPTLGLEFAGTVTRTGADVEDFKEGDKVVGFGPSSFANHVVTKAAAISHVPPQMSFEAAATIPSVFFTVYYALHHLAHLQPGEKVLIHGAAGGVGIAAVQLAKHLGAEIHATASSTEKRDFLHLLGVDFIYDSRSLSFADEILAQTAGSGIDVVLNSLAGEAINSNLQVLKPFGRFLELGKRDFYENTRIGLRPFRNNISYFGIDADQLMQERPDLTSRLFAEVMELFADGVLHPLPYHVFEAENIIDAFRFMQQAKHIGKIVVTYRNGIQHVEKPAAAGHDGLQLSASASYLISGGLGGFGLRTAQWLVEKGARHLVLVSRSGAATAEARQGVERLRKMGATVLAKACDISDRSALADLLESIAITLPPLRGVVHAAVVIDDGLINNLDGVRIERVLAPKIQGAQNLHDLTADMCLDLFVLFSSATTLFGNPGQASYVAANSWLEALAEHRRSVGLAATCVRWGAIEDTGFLARNRNILDALQNRMGGNAIPSQVALDMLESILLEKRSGLGVMELDWKSLSRFLPSSGSPVYAELARRMGGAHEGAGDHAEDIHTLMATLSAEALESRFISMIKQDVGEILRISADKIDSDRSIYDMGLDSLMGVELVVALETRFGLRLPVMALRESASISRLAGVIIDGLKSQSEADGGGEADRVRSDIRQLSGQHGIESSEHDELSLTARVRDSQNTNTTIIE